MHPVKLYKMGRDNVFAGWFVIIVGGIGFPLLFAYGYDIWTWKTIIFFLLFFFSAFAVGAPKINEGRQQMRDAWKHVEERERKEENYMNSIREGK